jgi:antitoxin component YwqK of YwqJK toxin-antitoxin module
MKKITCILFISGLALAGCRSSTSDQPKNYDTPVEKDTTHMRVYQQPKDTSKKNGAVSLFYPNGVIKEKSFYLDGRRNGECQSFYESGKLQSDDFFKEGLTDGPTVTYFENGQKRYAGTFTMGKPSGTWNFWDEKGKLVKTVNYGEKPL